MENIRFKQGLSDTEVENSRQKWGENLLTPPVKESVWKLLLHKFSDPIVIILLVALLASFGVATYHYFHQGGGFEVFLEPVGILVAILLATLIGFYFEVSANRKFEMLNQVNDDLPVKVLRNGIRREVPKRDIVVGDIVFIGTGDEIPADGILFESIALSVNESTLTGEPVIRKTSNPVEFRSDATYPSNSLYRGTTVMEGNGTMEVTAVGDQTEYGKVYEGSQIDTGIKTPLTKQLERLAELITKVSYWVAGILIVGRVGFYLIHHSGQSFDGIEFFGFALNTFMIAVTLIVVSVPEGLPMSVTLSLALSMKRMLKNNNLVRQMHACETMGSTTVICTDKTGTLTMNQMRVNTPSFYALPGTTLDGSDLSTLISEGIACNSTAFLDTTDESNPRPIGNPTEGALLLWLSTQQVDYLALREEAKIVDQLPFSTERKYMATCVNSMRLGRKVLYVKGAPEIVFGLSQQVLLDGMRTVPATEFAARFREEVISYQSRAMRTLGFGYVMLPEGSSADSIRLDQLPPLTFLGVIAISDPVRTEVPDAIRSCRTAGIQVKIVTGDTPATAREIGRQIGLWEPTDDETNAITGVEFEALSEEELDQRVDHLKIISRARPMDKKRLVESLQRQGHVVAVTGDGTNDAPALNAAQVGLSMGDGTQVAKEASAITILDNSFHSITKAVLWGRSLYQNIQRFIVFQLTINVAACATVLLSALIGAESPLTVTQMLWVNLIMDTFASLALASLPPNEKVMIDSPRKQDEHIITRPMGRLILSVGIFFVVVMLGLVYWFEQVDLQSIATLEMIADSTSGLSPYELTILFTLFVLLQFWNLFNARALFTGKSLLMNPRTLSGGFVVVALLILVGQYLIVTFGGGLFSVKPLVAIDWLILIGVSSLVFLVGEVIRIMRLFCQR